MIAVNVERRAELTRSHQVDQRGAAHGVNADLLGFEFFDERFAFDIDHCADHACRTLVERDPHFSFQLWVQESIEAFRHGVLVNLFFAVAEPHIRLAKDRPEGQSLIGLLFSFAWISRKHR